jgi:hypothetical protein
MYNVDNVYIGRKTINVSKELGSQINNFYPHHCGGDQKIQIKGANSSFRINYKYGFIASLLENSNLYHNSLLYDGWTINPAGGTHLINDPLDKTGFKTIPFINPLTYTLLATSDVLDTNLGDLIEFKVSVSTNGSDTGFAGFPFRVRNGAYYLKTDGTWTTDSGIVNSFILAIVYGNSSGFTFSVKAEGLPTSSDTYVEVYTPYTLVSFDITVADINSIDIVNRFEGNNIVGEFHTASRSIRVSSNIKENKTIYNGDNAVNLYLGAIFKEDGVTPTSVWNRKNSYELSPILRIAAEEELRISQRPLQIFDGSTYGQLPYLSVIEINGLNGVFMPIEYTYDTMSNIAKMKLLELFCPELSDLEYKFTYDYGETVKPTITG